MSSIQLAQVKEDVGYWLTASELAAVSVLLDLPALMLVDGGLGLLAFGKNLDLGRRRLANRGLVVDSEVDGDAELKSPFLDEFRHRFRSRRYMAELKVNDSSQPFPVSHIWASADSGSAVLRSAISDGAIRYLLLLTDADSSSSVFQQELALAPPSGDSAAGNSPESVWMSPRVETALRTGLVNGDELEIRRLCEEAVGDAHEVASLADLLAGEFSSYELSCEWRTGAIYEAEEIAWLVSESTYFWRFPESDGSTRFLRCQPAEIVRSAERMLRS